MTARRRRGCGCCEQPCWVFDYGDCADIRAGFDLNGSSPAGDWDCVMVATDEIESVATYVGSATLAPNIFYFYLKVVSPSPPSGYQGFDATAAVPEYTLELLNSAGDRGFKYELFESDAPGTGELLETIENVTFIDGVSSSTETLKLRRYYGHRLTTYNPSGSDWAGTTETETYYEYRWFVDGTNELATSVRLKALGELASYPTPYEPYQNYEAYKAVIHDLPTPRFNIWEDYVESLSYLGFMPSTTLSVPHKHGRLAHIPRGLWSSLSVKLINDGTVSIQPERIQGYAMQNRRPSWGMECGGTPPPTVTSVNDTCFTRIESCNRLDATQALAAYATAPTGTGITFESVQQTPFSNVCYGQSTSLGWRPSQEYEQSAEIMNLYYWSRPDWIDGTVVPYEYGPGTGTFPCGTGGGSFEYYNYQVGYNVIHDSEQVFVNDRSASSPYTHEIVTPTRYPSPWRATWYAARSSATSNTVTVYMYLEVWYSMPVATSGGTLGWGMYDPESWPFAPGLRGSTGTSYTFVPPSTACVDSESINCTEPTVVYNSNCDYYFNHGIKSSKLLYASQTFDICNDTFPKTLTFTFPEETFRFFGDLYITEYYNVIYDSPTYGAIEDHPVYGCGFEHAEWRYSQCTVPGDDVVIKKTCWLRRGRAEVGLGYAYDLNIVDSVVVDDLSIDLVIQDPYAFKGKLP